MMIYLQHHVGEFLSVFSLIKPIPKFNLHYGSLNISPPEVTVSTFEDC